MLRVLVACLTVVAAASLKGAESRKTPRLITSAIGVTRKGDAVKSLLGADDLDLKTQKFRVLIVGGTDHDSTTARQISLATEHFYSSNKTASLRSRILLSAVPDVCPSSNQGDVLRFPPSGTAYSDKQQPEAIYLWRWIGMHAPDLVIEITRGKKLGWLASETAAGNLRKLADALDAKAVTQHDSLVVQLGMNAPSNVGRVPALRVTLPADETVTTLLTKLDQALLQTKFKNLSPARLELQKRLARTPVQVAKQLGEVYGRDLDSITYIPALAAIAQYRLGKKVGDHSRCQLIEKATQPYIDGKSTKPGSPVSMAGHLVFCELAMTGSNKRHLELARLGADVAFLSDGNPSLANLTKSRMSDAVFMAGPILARVGKLTGEDKYFDVCYAYLLQMRFLTQRDDGLYRHSPADEAAWGRGNGFAALGLAMCLTDFPKKHPDRNLMIVSFRRHMEALVDHQDPTGAWHQVIDEVGSYRELTSTCMITFSMARGVKLGLLDREEFTPVIQRAWQAIKMRVATDGALVDVCTGTGAQKSLRDYYDRKAILGRDSRGGAMAFLVSTELIDFMK